MSKSGRILIVDDEPNARSALAELLREEGYTVETAADGLQALPKLDDFHPTVIITDLKMPGLDGLGLMRQSLAQEPARAVIVMTALGAVATAEAARRAGAADFLTKPINIDELLRVVESALEYRQLHLAAG